VHYRNHPDHACGTTSLFLPTDIEDIITGERDFPALHGPVHLCDDSHVKLFVHARSDIDALQDTSVEELAAEIKVATRIAAGLCERCSSPMGSPFHLDATIAAPLIMCTKEDVHRNKRSLGLSPTELASCVALDALVRAKEYYSLVSRVPRYTALVQTIGLMGPKFKGAIMTSAEITRKATEDLEGHRWALAAAAEALTYSIAATSNTMGDNSARWGGATQHSVDYIDGLLVATDVNRDSKESACNPEDEDGAVPLLIPHGEEPADYGARTVLPKPKNGIEVLGREEDGVFGGILPYAQDEEPVNVAEDVIDLAP
jgi:hypothetical protein